MDTFSLRAKKNFFDMQEIVQIPMDLNFREKRQPHPLRRAPIPVRWDYIKILGKYKFLRSWIPENSLIEK